MNASRATRRSPVTSSTSIAGSGLTLEFESLADEVGRPAPEPDPQADNAIRPIAAQVTSCFMEPITRYGTDSIPDRSREYLTGGGPGYCRGHELT